MKPSDHLRGVAVLLVGFILLMLGFPGLDLLSTDRWASGTPQRERMLKQPYGRIAVAASDVNRTIRMPIVKVLGPLLGPVRPWSRRCASDAHLRR